MLPMFAVSQDCDTLAKKQEWAAAGGTHVVVQVGWDTLQGNPGAPADTGAVAQVRANIADAVAAGLRVLYEPAAQYTPAWVQDTVPAYCDQSGLAYSGGLGKNIRDWVWSESGRMHLMDFYAKAMGFLRLDDLTVIDGIRCGFGYFGETSFPPVGSSSPYRWWGFSAPAQYGLDLATDQRMCPFPGRIPFSSAPVGTPAALEDRAWIRWYRRAATVRTKSIVRQYRSLGYRGNIYVLHPSVGVRSNWPTSDARWREQQAKGCDWAHQMRAYSRVKRTYGWCTWMDQSDWQYPPMVDDEKAPWRKLAELNRKYTGTEFNWGENAAGASSTQLATMFGPAGPMSKQGSGLLWVDWGSLHTGNGASLSDLAEAIAHYNPWGIV